MFARGRNGFMSNGNHGLFIDRFNTYATKCINIDTILEEKYIPPLCNRFIETYHGDFKIRW